MSHFRVIVSTDNGTTQQIAADENHVVSFLSNALKEQDCGTVTVSAEWVQ